jgi:hypothetical protein
MPAQGVHDAIMNPFMFASIGFMVSNGLDAIDSYR